jgi:cobalamin synthase
VVHAAVVLIPLASLGALIVVVSARARERFGWLTVAFAVAAAGAAITARLSGEALAESLGGIAPLIATHRQWGELAPWPAVALAITLPAGLLIRSRSKPAWVAAAALSVLAAVAALVLVALTGEAGARAVWGR